MLIDNDKDKDKDKDSGNGDNNDVNTAATYNRGPRVCFVDEDVEEQSLNQIAKTYGYNDDNYDEDDSNGSTEQSKFGKFKDDASLCLPSSTIRFRANNTTARVYPDERGQFIVEEKYVYQGDDKPRKRIVNAKWVETTNFSIQILRATYTLVATFFTGFLLVLAMELLLYVILDLTIEAGITNKGDYHAYSAFGVFLALPIYIYGLAEALVMSWFFMMDAWNGHLLVKQFGFGETAVVAVEWCTFFFYFGIPILTLIGTILGQMKDWWQITSLVWFLCISIAYIIFSIFILSYEFRANWEVTRNRFENDDDRWFCLINRSILMRQRNLFGGIERCTYLLRGDMEDTSKGFKGGHRKSKIMSDNISKGKTLYCKIVSWKIWEYWGMFEPVEIPEEQYTLDDVQDLRAFLTAHTWSLESIFCRARHSRYVVVLGGKQALTNAQMHSSAVCAVLGNTIGLLLLIAFLVWLGAPSLYCTPIVLLVVCFYLYPSMAHSYRIMKMTRNVFGIFKRFEKINANMRAVTGANSKKDDDDAFVLQHGESEAMFQVWESKRVITVTTPFCWLIFILEVIFLFLYPLVAVIKIGNLLMAAIFLVGSFIIFVRTYFNAATVIEETGKMDLVDGVKGSLFHWQNMSRLNTITTKVTRSSAKKIWMSALITLLLIFIGLGGMTVAGEAKVARNYFFTYLHEFEYKQQNDVPYPTCSSAVDSSKKNPHQMRSMADYTFLASLAYTNDNITQQELDQWFNNNPDEKENHVKFHKEAMHNFRKNDTQTTKGNPVIYKLIEFPMEKEAIVTIRGSTEPVDFMVDGQLWMGAALFQSLRYFMPLGNIWTPIMHYLIEAINLMESESIQKISFYKETTRFIQSLQRSTKYKKYKIQVTGHSLGGGLAIISGAQTGVAGIGVSAPNAKLSRMAFDLTIEDLDTKTFNIIPEHDPVAMIDDLAQNYQKIRCTANSASFAKNMVDCHGNGKRTLCEFLYTCGTQNRPALCECVYDFGYPKPTLKEGVQDKDFDEQCRSAGYKKQTHRI